MEKQVIQSTGFRNISENGEIIGFQLKIRLPYYRGVYLSQIKPGHLIVDGETFGEEEILWRVNGEDYSYVDKLIEQHKDDHLNMYVCLSAKSTN